MSPLTHPIPAKWLTAYYDGELDVARRDQVEAHLPECAECRRELEGLHALSQTLGSDALDQKDLTGSADFWRRVQSQLPDRRQPAPAAARISASRLVLRWSPGIGLLVLNGAVQAGALISTALIVLAPRLWTVPAWVQWGYQLAGNTALGWLAWLVPGNTSWLGLILLSLSLSAGLAVLYLAWLGYELRHGASALYGRVMA